jgi:transcriptional regulator with XRE-family HTH domain
MDSASELADIGKKVRKARQDRRITLEHLAKASNVSKSVLSQVERGVTNPTLSTLWNIAGALKLDPIELFGGNRRSLSADNAGMSQITPVEDPVIENDRFKYRLVILNRPELAGVSELYRLILKPGGALISNPHEDGAIEQLTVLKGEVQIRCGDDKTKAKAGKTVRYAGDLPHAISNNTKSDADVLLFVSFS